MTFYILHDEVRCAVRHLASMKHSDHSRMVYPSQRFYFLMKLFLDPFIIHGLGRLFKKDFDDDGLTHQFLIVRQVNNADPAAAEFSLNQIAPVERHSFIVSEGASARLSNIGRGQFRRRGSWLLITVCHHLSTVNRRVILV